MRVKAIVDMSKVLVDCLSNLGVWRWLKCLCLEPHQERQRQATCTFRTCDRKTRRLLFQTRKSGPRPPWARAVAPSPSRFGQGGVPRFVLYSPRFVLLLCTFLFAQRRIQITPRTRMYWEMGVCWGKVAMFVIGCPMDAKSTVPETPRERSLR